ncbi:MAG: rRNA adenine methyltransferase [Mesorhizobium sp.]|nr:MAG: rRNA adenine methyltransferase [Mesorhizobium sp.]
MNAHETVSSHPSISEAQGEARRDLAAAHRLAVKDNFIEGIDNHFTLAVPGELDRFYLNAFGLHWSEVKASNLIEVSLDGAVVAGNGIANLSAVCIHAPIHRRGIKCVLHTHMPYTTALSQLEDMRIQPSGQNGVVLQDMIAYDCDYNGFAETQDEGERMADVLGDKKILMLANHGAVATGDSVAKAYHRLYFLERAAMTQMIAMAAGKQRMISEAVQERIRNSLGAPGTDYSAEIRMYFDAMKRVLTAEGSDFAE